MPSIPATPSVVGVTDQLVTLKVADSEHLLNALQEAVTSSSGSSPAAIAEISALLVACPTTLLSSVTAHFLSSLANTSSSVRANTLLILSSFSTCPPAFRAYLASLFPAVLKCTGDKSSPVRTAALSACRAIVQSSDCNAVKNYLPSLFEGLGKAQKWQTKHASLNCITLLAELFPFQMSKCLPDIIPIISDIMWDTKVDTRNLAKTTMIKVCAVVGNKDIEPFIATLVSCIANPVEVAECIYKLSATTFVRTVEAPALAIMEPLLSRGLKENKTSIRRQTAVIIENMCKLLEDPADAQLFIPKLLPGLVYITEATADAECRQVAKRAHDVLFLAGGSVEVAEDDLKLEYSSIYKIVEEMLKQQKIKTEEVVLSYVSGIFYYFACARQFYENEWQKVINTYLNSPADFPIRALMDKCASENKLQKKIVYEDEIQEEGEVLCDCEFSLAYGGMILLNNARLKLIRGKRYGLCGPNGAGKSTLMRAIANGQVDGFPDRTQLKTIYVEHVLQADEAMMSVIDFIHSDAELKALSREEIIKSLCELGFTDQMQNGAVSALSGGWKMKLELARAMLLKADVLLLDEPTNHLDVKNVKWLEDYLTGLTNVTSMIVSHDSSFLDNVCTGIVHYEQRKLKAYRGNLSEFVKQYPAAKAYYTLQASTVEFHFPEPGYLSDVKNKGKPIMRLNGCSYTYPGCSSPSISGITVSCSLASRIAVIGPNGAGKSTLIKILTGEVEPQTGTVTKHPSLRFAYVAQHAFHHIEQYLDKSANEYIQWRFQSGEDKELLAKDTRKLTKEEKDQMKKPVVWDGEKRVIEEIVGRRKFKKSFEYEIEWEKTVETSWIPRDKLIQWKLEKQLQMVDDREAARANLQARPCTSGAVQKHLDCFGLQAEFGTHSRMRGLSGGQKVKVVLAAAMWQNPHILVLDEPTNYLDRDSLGALAKAIEEFGGGVVMISHHSEFTKALCVQEWNVEAGRLTISGEVAEDKTKLEIIDEQETLDAFGNVVKSKIKKKLTRKELKAKAKLKKEAEARGEYWSDSDDE